MAFKNRLQFPVTNDNYETFQKELLENGLKPLKLGKEGLQKRLTENIQFGPIEWEIIKALQSLKAFSPNGQQKTTIPKADLEGKVDRTLVARIRESEEANKRFYEKVNYIARTFRRELGFNLPLITNA